jgi:hypothetical protein
MPKGKYRSHKQKVYKMKGCSTRKRRNLKGGLPLAYPSNNVPKVPNPFLAYVPPSKGGGTGNVYPAKAPPLLGGNYFINPQVIRGGEIMKKGGSCSICSGNMYTQTGGTCSTCYPDAPIVLNGLYGGKQRGGDFYKPAAPYPNGLVGQSWGINDLPGTGVAGDYNHYRFNTQNNNPQMDLQANSANPPGTVGGAKRSRKNKKGGALSNFMFQDVVNLGRQINYGLGSTYNTLAGYKAPVNPLPWKDQLPNRPNII